MKIEQFRYFVTINRLHSISAAAKQYGIRQNTLSAIVSAAEEEFGFSIFQRTPGGVICTPKGEKFILLAKGIDAEYSRIMGVKKQVRGKASVRIVMDPVTNSVLALPLTERYHDLSVRGNLRFETEDSAEVIEKVCSGQTNTGLLRIDAELRQVLEEHEKRPVMEVHSLAADELCVVVRDSHPLAQLDAVDAESLWEHQLAWHRAMTREITDVIGLPQSSCLGTMAYSSSAHVKLAVAKSGMAAVVSRFTAEHEPVWRDESLRIIALDNVLRENVQELVLLYRSDTEMRYLDRTLVECIHGYFDEIRGRGICDAAAAAEMCY